MSGGTGVSVYGSALAETVRSLGHDVEWLTSARTGGRWATWRGALRPGAWPVPLGDAGRIAGDAFRSAQVRFDLRRSLLTVRDRRCPPALMHWTYPLPLSFADVPNLYTVHDLIPLLHPALSPVPQRRMERLLHRVLAAAAHVVTVSEASRREIIDTFGLSAGSGDQHLSNRGGPATRSRGARRYAPDPRSRARRVCVARRVGRTAQERAPADQGASREPDRPPAGDCRTRRVAEPGCNSPTPGRASIRIALGWRGHCWSR